MLVSADDRAVDQLQGLRRLGRQGLEDAQPNALLGPAVEAIVGRGVGAVAFRQIAPRRASPKDEEDAVEDLAIIRPRPAILLALPVAVDPLIKLAVALLVTAALAWFLLRGMREEVAQRLAGTAERR